MYLPQNIKHLAAIAGMKNNELSKHLGVTPTQVGAYMKGKANPKMETLITLGKLFNVNVHDLILVDLTKESGREFDSSSERKTVDDQTKELNKLLRLRVAELEREIKEENPDLARELGIE
ncbi:MAG: helix-turn-helix transcriptional regulator [Bacteroidota bacterium]